MTSKRITVLVLCFLLSAVFQQLTVAQEAAPVRTIPIISIGFGAKLSPDGKTLVTFENTNLHNLDKVDPTLLPMRVIDISAGRGVGSLFGFSDYAADVAFTSDGSKLVSVHQNGDIYVWDMATWKVLKTFQTPLFGNVQIRMFPDNKRILTLLANIPQHFVVVDTESGAITQTLGTHFDSFLDFQTNYTKFPAMGDIQFAGFGLSPDGSLLATSSYNDEVRLWTVADNHYQVVREKSEQFAQFNIRQLAFMPDGKDLIYYDLSDKKTHIWDIAAKSEKAALAVGSDSFALSPDGTMMAWATREKDKPNTVSIAPVDAPDKASVILTLPDGLEVAPRVTWVAFTPDGKQVVVGGFFARDDAANQIYVLNVP